MNALAAVASVLMGMSILGESGGMSTSGGMRRGECPIFSMKEDALVDAFTVFIMSNLTLGNAFAQPLLLHSTWNHRH